MYVLKDDGKIAGMIAVTMSQGEDYHNIKWEIELNDDEVTVLHILAVCPEYQKKGIAKILIKESIKLADKRGKKAVRLDTLASNTPAQRIYEGLGFVYRGKENLYAENTGYTDFYYYEMILGK